jgi:hypothetical protein
VSRAQKDSRRWRLAWLAVLLCAAPAGAGESLEYAVKGTYLYKFIPFVEWPSSAFATPAAPFTICVFGDDPFGPALAQAVRGQKGARPLAVQDIQSIDAVSQCQILYAGKDAPLADVLHAAQGKPILTVTENQGPVHGIINFVLEGPHVRFDIDDASAAESGLTISSKLLGLAHRVIARRAGP